MGQMKLNNVAPLHRYPEPLHEIVKACLVADPDQRPTARQLFDMVAGLKKQTLNER